MAKTLTDNNRQEAAEVGAVGGAQVWHLAAMALSTVRGGVGGGQRTTRRRRGNNTILLILLLIIIIIIPSSAIGSSQRGGFFNIGSGRVVNKIPGSGSGKCVKIYDRVFPGIFFALRYFRVRRVFSGISGFTHL